MTIVRHRTVISEMTCHAVGSSQEHENQHHTLPNLASDCTSPGFTGLVKDIQRMLAEMVWGHLPQDIIVLQGANTANRNSRASKTECYDSISSEHESASDAPTIKC